MNEGNKENGVQLERYEKEYSESKFWDKVGNVAKKVGQELIYNVLLLFYAMQSENVSAKEKAMIIGALGYFILPIDIVSDAIPVVGFSDDAAILLAIIKLLCCIDDAVREKAKTKLLDWFDDAI